MHDTMTWVYASEGKPLAIQRDLTTKAFPVRRSHPPVGRPTTAVGPDTLGRVRLPGSWLLVALVTSARDLDRLAAWAEGKDPGRIRLYFAPGTDVHSAMKGWAEKRLPLPRTGFYGDVPAFRHEVGVSINNRIGADFG